MAMPEESRRVKYTKTVLRQALLDLLKTTPFDQITVTKLCGEADVARGTFYLHYDDTADLLADIEDSVLDMFESHLQAKDATATPQDYWTLVLTGLASQRDLLALLFSIPQGRLVGRCLALNRAYSTDRCRAKYPDLSDEMIDYMQTFLEQGSASLIVHWISQGCTVPIGELADLLSQLNEGT
ncbi:MAG: TetR/AcrR family transcriptional regulator [Propionibacteriaceae bacterium]|jgi:AcrR family transcriptional regulator|nr:TetR/AcrR family transcriptional regulator [Propionibacteriaceae bacterium]